MKNQFQSFSNLAQGFSLFAQSLQEKQPTIKELNDNLVKASIEYRKQLKELNR